MQYKCTYAKYTKNDNTSIGYNNYCNSMNVTANFMLVLYSSRQVAEWTKASSIKCQRLRQWSVLVRDKSLKSSCLLSRNRGNMGFRQIVTYSCVQSMLFHLVQIQIILDSQPKRFSIGNKHFFPNSMANIIFSQCVHTTFAHISTIIGMNIVSHYDCTS